MKCYWFKSKWKSLSTLFSKSSLTYFLVFLLICIVITNLSWAYLWFVVENTNPDNSNTLFGDRGTFGDMFGALNALFSGLAFAGIIITILMQMNELRATVKAQESQAERMRISSTIDAMNSYKSIFDKSTDEHFAASQILKYTTEKIFSLQEYEHLLWPRIRCTNSSIDTTPPNDRTTKSISVELTNTGTHLVDLDLGELKDKQRSLELKRGQTESFYMEPDKYNFPFMTTITFLGIFDGKRWSQELVIKKLRSHFYNIVVRVPKRIDSVE